MPVAAIRQSGSPRRRRARPVVPGSPPAARAVPGRAAAHSQRRTARPSSESNSVGASGPGPSRLVEQRLELRAVEVARTRPWQWWSTSGSPSRVDSSSLACGRVQRLATGRRSASAAGSTPQDSRIIPSSIRAARRSSGVSEKCEELNGVLTSVSTPPRLVASHATRSLRITRSARSSPPATVNGDHAAHAATVLGRITRAATSARG